MNPKPTDSPLIAHAKRELRYAELDQKDADYGGMLGTATLALVRLFAKQRHSGTSGQITLALFNKLVNFQPLTPITDDPKEWRDVGKEMLSTEDRMSGKQIWQNIRAPHCFSNDSGKTYWNSMDNEYKIKSQPKGDKSFDDPTPEESK
jgi:hypothetical protein